MVFNGFQWFLAALRSGVPLRGAVGGGQRHAAAAPEAHAANGDVGKEPGGGARRLPRKAELLQKAVALSVNIKVN